jgi:Domain of unknown function (DUF4112)
LTYQSAAGFAFRRNSRTTPVDVRRTRDRLARFAWLLDSAFRVPGTGVRIGLEPLLGFVPGIGDALGKLLSVYLVYEAWRLGVPAPVLLRMLGNVAVDTVIGIVPVVGDIGDVFWRANRMNIALLDAHLAGAEARRGPQLDGEWHRVD